MDAHIERHIRDKDYRRALDALIATHGPGLGRFLISALGSREDGEEALQDTLVRALNAMPDYRGDNQVKPWLFGIARHVLVDHVRKKSRRRSLWARFFRSDEEETPDPHAQTDARLTLAGALSRLSPALRAAVLLRYQQGMDATEVADTLAISHAAARKRISLGLQALRTELADLAPSDIAPALPQSALSESRP
jgi:RNA polymerase sigma-70 factor (ECF subfamily)